MPWVERWQICSIAGAIASLPIPIMGLVLVSLAIRGNFHPCQVFRIFSIDRSVRNVG